MLFRSDRKSTRLNSSHLVISYAVFCLKKKKTTQLTTSYEERYRTDSSNTRTHPARKTGPCLVGIIGCMLLKSLDGRACFFFFFNDTATTEIYTLSLHDALPI